MGVYMYRARYWHWDIAVIAVLDLLPTIDVGFVFGRSAVESLQP